MGKLSKIPVLLSAIALATACSGVITAANPAANGDGGGGPIGDDDDDDDDNVSVDSGPPDPNRPDAGTSEPCTECQEGLFPQMPDVGEVSVTLHPGPTVSLNESTLVPFALPLPPGTVDDVANLRVIAGGTEVAAEVEELTRWRPLASTANLSGVRAARIWIEHTFTDRSPVVITVEYGVARTQQLGSQGSPRDRWVPVAQNDYPDEYPAGENLLEPEVYASLPASWLSACLLRTRTTDANSDAAWSVFDGFFVGAGLTAVNDLPSSVDSGSYINYANDAAPWLFDRAMTLWGIYVRTGDVKWMRHAHRASQCYANHLNSGGYFDLKSDDLKYSYGQAMLVDLMLVGDTSLLDEIERAATPGRSWSAAYSGGFWTERHETYALLSALSAWEATGSTEYRDRVNSFAAAMFDMAESPTNGWTPEGCLLHSYADHEGGGSSEPVCSPWMSALLADAVWRYYLHSNDQRALEFLANLADFVATTGTYSPGGSIPGIIPYYLVSSRYSTGEDTGSDAEHACDVLGLVARGAWSRRALGGNPAQLLTTADSLRTSCEYILNDWHRDTASLPEWRLTPPRKFSWWFGTTSDLPWLLTDLAH